MTDSELVAARPRAAVAGKRERLVASATDLVHRHGVQATTLALVAKAADVPLGNVYYYFKTRDDLIRAVVDGHAQRIDELLAILGRGTTPRDRLAGLARNWADAADLLAESGCPIGGLSADLARLDGGLHECAGLLPRAVLDWATRQFRELGVPDAPAEAASLLARVLGAALLTNAFHDPALMSQEMRRIERTIDDLAAGAAGAR
ncbi:TetR/AcrR family transcriptional regulator [Pseudofrankia saprophytica]|uniref:TetR/AcrR family transcriptional regulator n=1 Tax=Pseudofrankia saprophytica TaxID=298655 RepID=UPI000234B97C|nr:TetR/AcrR family transcriptional regulator [Pseudofrankia saprophytica]